MRLLTLLIIGGALALVEVSNAAEVTFVGMVERGGMKSRLFRLEGEISNADVDNVKSALARAGITHEQADAMAGWRGPIVAICEHRGECVRLKPPSM